MVTKHSAFTLAEVLITLGIIGVVAALTIPTLVNAYQEREMVTGLLKFNSTLQQAVQLWKNDLDCTEEIATCYAGQSPPDDNCANFDQLGKFLKISTQSDDSNTDHNWLPAGTLDYYGNSLASDTWAGVSNNSTDRCRYLLQDGSTMSVDVDPTGFWLYVDVNGKKLPNRFGKDTFPFVIGYMQDTNYPYKSNKDVDYYTRNSAMGLCGIDNDCNPKETNPSGDSASITSYVVLNSKLPDFKALSQTVSGFKP